MAELLGKGKRIVEDVIHKVEIINAMADYQLADLGHDLRHGAESHLLPFQQGIGAVTAGKRTAPLGLQVGHAPFVQVAGYVKEGPVRGTDPADRFRRPEVCPAGQHHPGQFGRVVAMCQTVQQTGQQFLTLPHHPDISTADSQDLAGHERKARATQDHPGAGLADSHQFGQVGQVTGAGRPGDIVQVAQRDDYGIRLITLKGLSECGNRVVGKAKIKAGQEMAGLPQRRGKVGQADRKDRIGTAFTVGRYQE